MRDGVAVVRGGRDHQLASVFSSASTIRQGTQQPQQRQQQATVKVRQVQAVLETGLQLPSLQVREPVAPLADFPPLSVWLSVASPFARPLFAMC